MIELNGHYHGRNLYVQNPFSANGVGFCVTGIRVNGNYTTDETSSSAFEINLVACGLRSGDAVSVVIEHKDGCKPKVLNPEVLKPRSTFEVTQFLVEPHDGGHLLKWQTRNEEGKLDFIAEQFRWNRWVKVGTTEGTGLAGPNQYQLKVNLNSGENRFRVKQVDYTGMQRASKITVYPSAMPAVTFSLSGTGTEISFSAETMYEIYDRYGNKILSGLGTRADIQSLPPGGYVLSYDNTTGEFVKR